MSNQVPIDENGNTPTVLDTDAIVAASKNLHAANDIDGREGLVCTRCDTVFYMHKGSSTLQRDAPCPFCGGQIYWITTGHQPLESPRS